MQRVRIDIDPDWAPTRSRSTRSGWKRNSISPTYFRASCFASETINLELSSNSATAGRHDMGSIGPFRRATDASALVGSNRCKEE